MSIIQIFTSHQLLLAMIWICKQAERICECEVKGSEYIVDSGHYRYKVYFPKSQE